MVQTRTVSGNIFQTIVRLGQWGLTMDSGSSIPMIGYGILNSLAGSRISVSRRAWHRFSAGRTITGPFFWKRPRHLYMINVVEVSRSGNWLLFISLKASGPLARTLTL